MPSPRALSNLLGLVSAISLVCGLTMLAVGLATSNDGVALASILLLSLSVGACGGALKNNSKANDLETEDRV
jgi:hypothetical protein